MTDLPDRLVRERNRIRDVLGRRWKAATLLSSGRLFLDFGCLLGVHPRLTGAGRTRRPVLRAPTQAAGLLALIPITPGGLGIVEAGLSGLLILAGVPGVDAVVATLAYRIISYWLPILVGPFAYMAFRAPPRPARPRRRRGPRGGRPALAGRAERRCLRSPPRRAPGREWVERERGRVEHAVEPGGRLTCGLGTGLGVR